MSPAARPARARGSRDAWFVGYTAQYVAGVWIGNDDATKMRNVTGGSLPAKVWHDIMLYAHQGKAPLPLPGTGRPQLEDAGLKWSAPSAQNEDDGQPFYRRVFGILSGG